MRMDTMVPGPTVWIYFPGWMDGALDYADCTTAARMSHVTNNNDVLVLPLLQHTCCYFRWTIDDCDATLAAYMSWSLLANSSWRATLHTHDSRTHEPRYQQQRCARAAAATAYLLLLSMVMQLLLRT
jgi:hypothetical protein